MSTTTSLKLDDELKDRVNRLAQARDRSPHWILRQAVVQYVTREEERDEMWREATAALERYDASGLHLTFEEADAWLSRLAAVSQQHGL